MEKEQKEDKKQPKSKKKVWQETGKEKGVIMQKRTELLLQSFLLTMRLGYFGSDCNTAAEKNKDYGKGHRSDK